MTALRQIISSTGRGYEVVGKLGEGGQGAVYMVKSGVDVCALKWYDASATAGLTPAHVQRQRSMIERLLAIPPPSSTFVWPTELAALPGEPDSNSQFGYLMPLIGSGFEIVSSLYRSRQPVQADLRILFTMGRELADAMLRLHTSGLCYRDISAGNVFFRPTDGSVRICDNDNVGVDGVIEGTIRGTMRYMAPELVRRDAEPSATTDLHSLAVLLFYVLVAGHPLLGGRVRRFAVLNRSAESELFGSAPLFVMHPHDPSNRPWDGAANAVERNWAILPAPLTELFTRAFTVGLDDPYERVRESEWRRELARAADALARCPACAVLRPIGDAKQPCWHCAAPQPAVFRAVSSFGDLVIDIGTEIPRHLVDGSYRYETSVARVESHPTNPRKVLLRNTSSSPWQVEIDGSDEAIEVATRSACSLPRLARFRSGSNPLFTVEYR